MMHWRIEIFVPPHRANGPQSQWELNQLGLMLDHRQMSESISRKPIQRSSEYLTLRVCEDVEVADGGIGFTVTRKG
jgi:hypothetical protein